jgi:hypothetical protein
MKIKKKKIKIKVKRKNPMLGVISDINKLISLLEDTKIALSDKNSKFYEDDILESKVGIKTLSKEILLKLD